MSSHDDEHGTGPRPGQYGQPPPYGGPPYQPSPSGPSAATQGRPYGQAGPPQYDPYGQYGSHGQYGPYGSPAAGPPGQYGPYGPGSVPARPTPVVVAAVLGSLFGALGALVSLGLILGGAVLGALVEDLVASDPSVSATDPGEVAEFTDAAQVFAISAGVVALLWTALVIWGSVRALTGRSRVPLLVGGAIAVAVTAVPLLAALSGLASGGTGGAEVVFVLLFFLPALAIVVLLCLRPAAQFYAAHRARRAR
ncbi:hypothetical protein SAMN06893096_101594 [Geodermatophilus pulveris]|uniref:Uncharacterized protein n=1 Tax=Geodermatophilus pulveris TaxID=1564159 RepID=A0A239BC83_9ACTN|nr:hypothetical protein [Geodermatophilus pulveris]SNS05520.1 hypothetical protein SAMN06893096_101594 [Geodermatophilus pulveris]